MNEINLFGIRSSVYPYLLSYIFVATVLWYIKPALMFTERGDMKEFGTRYGQTIFYYPIVLILIAMLLFYLHELTLAS